MYIHSYLCEVIEELFEVPDINHRAQFHAKAFLEIWKAPSSGSKEIERDE